MNELFIGDVSLTSLTDSELMEMKNKFRDKAYDHLVLLEFEDYQLVLEDINTIAEEQDFRKSGKPRVDDEDKPDPTKCLKCGSQVKAKNLCAKHHQESLRKKELELLATPKKKLSSGSIFGDYMYG